MNLSVKLITLASISILAGCDTINGVSRSTSTGMIQIPVNCILQATESVRGVSSVVHRIEKGSKELTLGGIQNPEIVDRFIYKYSGLSGNFYFITNYKGETNFNHTYIYINSTPPQSEIDTIRPAMIEIEKSIYENCGINLNSSKSNERCRGVACGGT